jgi:hypothetical protein
MGWFERCRPRRGRRRVHRDHRAGRTGTTSRGGEHRRWKSRGRFVGGGHHGDVVAPPVRDMDALRVRPGLTGRDSGDEHLLYARRHGALARAASLGASRRWTGSPSASRRRCSTGSRPREVTSGSWRPAPGRAGCSSATIGGSVCPCSRGLWHSTRRPWRMRFLRLDEKASTPIG